MGNSFQPLIPRKRESSPGPRFRGDERMDRTRSAISPRAIRPPYSTTVRVGPRLASPSALDSARAKLAFSSGPRQEAIDSRRPRETRNNRSMPNSSCTMRSSRTHTGLSVHSRTRPCGLTLRRVSSEDVTLTSS